MSLPEALEGSRSFRVPQGTGVTVAITVLNEASSIGELLESLCQQTLAPDEVVVVDGGSTDGTLDLLRSFQQCLPLIVLVHPGSTIAAGRNRAIEASNGDFIAVTDAGVRLSPGWLEALVRPLTDGRADVSSGFFHSDPRSVFELALGATTLPEASDIKPEQFLPSSRSVAFTRKVWASAGGYPDDLDYCEDLVFDLRLKEAGCRFAWVPEAVAHTRPRPDLPSFFRQYYRYARGDGKADLWRRHHAIRYAAYLALLLGLRTPWAWPFLLAGGVAYLRRPVGRLTLSGLAPAERAQALALVPVIRVVGDVAKMLGYPAGVWWRLRR